jgi:2-amino-4-hydroxy-6-hydroxymethyldihydropteridine diphosphokinase
MPISHAVVVAGVAVVVANRPAMAEAFVGLGSNLADPPRQLQAAIKALAALPGTELKCASGFYRSAAIGPAGQPDYCNAVAQLVTALAPLALLDALQGVEAAAGRVRAERWGPRLLDLDLLAYDDVVLRDPRLTLPHPELARRDFVLVPLAEIAPQVVLPGLGVAAELLARLPRQELPPWA